MMRDRRLASHPRHVRVIGRMACFTRPEFRMERYSNVVGSTSAWEGLLNAVMGHRPVRFDIESVALLFYPRWETHTINEISNFGDGWNPIDVTARRTLRTTSFVVGNRRVLRRRGAYDDGPAERLFSGVDYVVTFRVSAPAGEFNKLNGMTDRRLKNGHFWRQPYLGQRELPAIVEPVDSFTDITYPDMQLVEHASGLRTADYSAHLGLCFYGIDWDDPAHPYYFFPLEVRRGIVTYPTWDEVRRHGVRRKGSRC